MGRRIYRAGEAALIAGERSQRREISQVLDVVKANISKVKTAQAAFKLELMTMARMIQDQDDQDQDQRLLNELLLEKSDPSAHTGMKSDPVSACTVLCFRPP